MALGEGHRSREVGPRSHQASQRSQSSYTTHDEGRIEASVLQFQRKKARKSQVILITKEQQSATASFSEDQAAEGSIILAISNTTRILLYVLRCIQALLQ